LNTASRPATGSEIVRQTPLVAMAILLKAE
jgi:hypothetical protein